MWMNNKSTLWTQLDILGGLDGLGGGTRGLPTLRPLSDGKGIWLSIAFPVAKTGYLTIIKIKKSFLYQTY